MDEGAGTRGEEPTADSPSLTRLVTAAAGATTLLLAAAATACGPARTSVEELGKGKES